MYRYTNGGFDLALSKEKLPPKVSELMCLVSELFLKGGCCSQPSMVQSILASLGTYTTKLGPICRTAKFVLCNPMYRYTNGGFDLALSKEKLPPKVSELMWLVFRTVSKRRTLVATSSGSSTPLPPGLAGSHKGTIYRTAKFVSCNPMYRYTKGGFDLALSKENLPPKVSDFMWLVFRTVSKRRTLLVIAALFV